MDPLVIALVSATTALVSAILGPLISFVVSGRQIRATVISNNRERWLEALRDSVAEYVGLLLTAAMVKQGIELDTAKALSGDSDLRRIAERIVVVKNKILLLSNPAEQQAARLCELVEKTYLALASETPQSIATIRAEAEAITQAGRDVLRREWARVKRGE
jgi:hypothetical protein